MGKPWNQNLGSDSALFDVAVAAFRKAGNPKNKKAVANAMRTLRVDTPLGHLDWAKDPCRTSSPRRSPAASG